MSAPGNRRDRANEPSEQLRAERQRKGKCIDCGENAKGRQRCAKCLKRVEDATDRYRGQGKRGRTPLIATDIRDIRFAAEELGKAYSGYAAIEMLGAMSSRKRDELLAEPQHHALLAWKFLGEVLDRAGMIQPKKPSKPAKADPTPPAPSRQLMFRWQGAR